MKHRLLLMVAGLALAALALPAGAQTTAFTYQGELNAEGTLADGSFDMRFGLFAASAGGTQIGSDQTVSAVPVSDGLFTVQLDFGVSAFPGANRFLEISVRPAGIGTFTTLAPRQQISSTPYAIRTLSAASADALSSACVGCVKDTQIETVSGNKVSGAIPVVSVPGGSGNYIQNTGAPQAAANFNITGNGTIGGLMSSATASIGGAALPADVSLAVNGPARVAPGGTGYLQLGTPGSELGLSILGAANRADLRFNDTTLKLVAGPGLGPPGSTSGLSVNTAGAVGIGLDSGLAGRLHVVSTDVPAIYAESANRAVWGRSTGASRGVYGDSVSGEGVHGESTSGTGVAGVSHGPDGTAMFGFNDTGGTGILGRSVGGFNIGFAMMADGHAKQTRDKGGWLKAMAYVAADGTIIRCYSSQDPVFRTTGDCGMSVDIVSGYYIVNFGFNVADRFISVTAVQTDILVYPIGYLVPDDNANAWGVEFRNVAEEEISGSGLASAFMIFVL